MNLRFVPMSAALGPFFRAVTRWHLLFSSQVVSASSFIVPYLQFQKERDTDNGARSGADGYGNLAFFLGVGVTAYSIWVVGTTVGFGVALGFPSGFDEALKFILPGYFAGLLVAEMKGWAVALICAASLVAAVPGALVSEGWGWLATAIVIAVSIWGLEEWNFRASKSS
jgi:predicted branched-subunit amino acid permease